MELGGLWWTNVLNSVLPPQSHRPDTWLEHQDPVSQKERKREREQGREGGKEGGKERERGKEREGGTASKRMEG